MTSYDKIDNLDIDASIYELGLIKNDEAADISQFHNADINGKIQIIDSTVSKRISTLGLRVLFRNYHDQLNENIKNKVKESITHPDSVNIRGKARRSPLDAIDEANNILLKEDLDEDQSKILKEYLTYLNRLKN